MGGFQGRNDPFMTGQLLEGIQGFLIGDGDVFGTPGGGQMGVLRADRGEVQTRRDGVGLLNLAVFILHQVGVHAEEDPLGAMAQRRAMFATFDAVATGLDTDQAHAGIINEIGKHADGIGAAADTGDDRIGQPVLGSLQLHLGFFADHALELAHYGREGVGTGGSSQHVVGIFVVGGPVAQRLVTGILEGGGACGDRHDFGTHQAHAEDVGLLPLHIHGAHVDAARQIEQGTGQCRRHTMLTGAGFGDDAGLAHAFGQQGLTQHLVGLVGATVQQVFTLEVELGLGALGQVATQGQRSRAPGVLGQQGTEFLMKGRIGLGIEKGFFQLQECRNQDLRHIHAAKFTEKRVEQSHHNRP